MEVRLATWKISDLYRLRDKINPQPPYQRGEVWSDRKKALLIDSILRGIDIPKIYLRTIANGAHDYEVADGQQRLNAIFTFLDSDFALLDGEEKGLNLRIIGKTIVGNKKFSQLSASMQKNLTNYAVSIALIEKTDNHEIRTLFGRLQEGDPLVPAEKRNAIISRVGTIIDNFAINSKFFQTCKIPAPRFKRQDYLSHALALYFYKNSKPLKANLLLELYLDKKINCTSLHQRAISDILDAMYEIDMLSTTRIHKKFHFIDVFLYLNQNIKQLDKLDYKKFAEIFDAWEGKRLKVIDPKILLDKKSKTVESKILYDYYMAFKFAGAEPDSIKKRNQAFSKIFNDVFLG